MGRTVGSKDAPLTKDHRDKIKLVRKNSSKGMTTFNSFRGANVDSQCYIQGRALANPGRLYKDMLRYEKYRYKLYKACINGEQAYLDAIKKDPLSRGAQRERLSSE